MKGNDGQLLKQGVSGYATVYHNHKNANLFSIP